MRRARNVDPKCLCEFDMAVNIPPSRMHWARFEVHNMAPINQRNDSQHNHSYDSIIETRTRAARNCNFPDNYWPHHSCQFYHPSVVIDKEINLKFHDGNEISANSVITLVACTNRSIIDEKFGKKTKIDHWPQFPMAQFELTHLQAIPIFGSFNVTPGGLRQPVQSKIQDYDYDDFSTDLEGSVNYDEDYDDNHGE